jgi:hypothetical protein
MGGTMDKTHKLLDLFESKKDCRPTIQKFMDAIAKAEGRVA